MQNGYNENIDVGGVTYHIQTEDVTDRAEVVSQVFVGGVVLHTYRVSYADWKSEENWRSKVASQAKKQHTLMMAAASRGRFATPGGENP
ncbi:MAG: hypothetical protein ACE5FN_01575 [Leptospirillia bacterium]